MIKENIQRLVANAKIEQAIDEFINWASANDDDINNSLILIKGQFSALKRQENLGLMSFSDASRDRARIANSILELSNQIIEGEHIERKENIKLATQAQFFNKKEAQETLAATGKILFLAANPTDSTKLELEREFAKIHNKLQDTQYKLVAEWALTPSDLQDALLEHRPRIIHFSGHGIGKKEDGTRAIGRPSDTEQQTGILLQDSSGKSKLVSGKAIANLFGICLEEFTIDAVILNACYSEEQAKGIFQAGVPYVIGMNRAVNDDTAIEFSVGFYRGIASVNDIKKAFRFAKNAIELEGLAGDDIPVLYEKE